MSETNGNGRIVDVQEIDVFYGPIQALRGVTLHLAEGEMVALLGANGAGKTTTLRAISGLLSPARGRIAIGGRDATGLRANQVVRLGVAHLPEGRELFAEMTVLENLKLGHWTARRDKAAETRLTDRMMELFPRLRERSGQAAGTLSGGEQQMLAVARALMSEPRLLLVDELSLGLAPIVVRQLFEAIREVNRLGTAVLLVEQFVHLALEYTSRAYVLARGEVAMDGASRELLASPELMAAYLGESAGATEAHVAPAETPAPPSDAAPAKRNGGGRRTTKPLVAATSAPKRGAAPRRAPAKRAAQTADEPKPKRSPAKKAAERKPR
jgi:branched-chain amino acid transport system ATP-binding protein